MFFPVCRLIGHAADVTRVRIAPDFSSLSSSSADKSVIVWDPSTGQAVRTLEGHGEEAADIAYHGSGSGLFTSCLDGTARLFDLRSEKATCCATFKAEASEELCCIASGNSINSPVLITGSTSGNITFHDIRSGSLGLMTFAHYSTVCSLEVSGNDSLATSSSLDGSIRIWSVAEGDCLMSLNEKTSSSFPCMYSGFTSDGKGVIGLFLNSSLRRWNFMDKINSDIKFIGPKMTNSTKTFTNIDRLGNIAVPLEDGSVHFLNSRKGAATQPAFKAHSDDVLSVDCRGDLLVSSGAGEDSSVVIWTKNQQDEIIRDENYNLSYNLVSPQIEGLI